MPPATEPVPLLILQSMETALGLADGGADYFYDLNVVKIGQDISQAAVFPAVTIGVGEVGKALEVKDGRALWSGNYHWDVLVTGMLEGVEPQHVACLRLVHDIHKALMVDPFRTVSGQRYAVNTIVTGFMIYPPESEAKAYSMVEVGVEVHFRTADESMLTVY